jgi:hypothetical protein
MDGRDDRSPSRCEHPTAISEDTEPSLAGQSSDGRSAKGNDYSSGRCLDVVHESCSACVDCPDSGLGRVRPAGNGVGDENVGLPKVDIAEGLPKHIASWPNKGALVDDLLCARGLTDEDDAARGPATGADGRAILAIWTAEAMLDDWHGRSVTRPSRRLRPRCDHGATSRRRQAHVAPWRTCSERGGIATRRLPAAPLVASLQDLMKVALGYLHQLPTSTPMATARPPPNSAAPLREMPIIPS